MKPKKPQKILLVEDEESIRDSLGSFLEFLGVDYASAADGQEAISFLKAHEVDVLITDFRMPKVDGVELLKWCRANDRHFPVIFITANADLLEKENIALKDCCASLVRKPIQLDHLENALKAALVREHHEDCVHNKLTKR